MGDSMVLNALTNTVVSMSGSFGSAESGPDSTDDIMSATFRALSKHGYASLSMQDIADEFDKSRSLLHYHYDTRDDLILAFVDNLIGHKADRLEESDTESPPKRLLEYLDHFTRRSDRRRGFAVALFELRMQALHDDRLHEKLSQHYCQNIKTAAGIIAEGIESGVFHPVDPHGTAEMLYNAIQGAAFCELVLGFDGAIQQMRDQLVHHVVSDLVDVPNLLSGESDIGRENVLKSQ
jgi:AcrR family transcriptional regulator